MKIKNNSELFLKPLYIGFIASVVICIIIRIIQTAKFIDPKTGFSVGGGILSAALYGIIAVFTLFSLTVSFISKESGKNYCVGIKNFLLGCVAAFFGLTLSYDCLYSLFSCFESLTESSSLSGVKGLMSTGSLPLAVQSFFAFFASFYIYILAVGFFKGNDKASKHKLLALAPVGWAAFRLIHRFIRQISFVEVSDLFLELIMLGLAVMFFVAFAQVNSGVYSDGFAWRITGFGFPAALIALTVSFTRLIFAFVSEGSFVNPEHPFNIADFAFPFFIIVLLFELRKHFSANASAEISE